MTVLSNYLVLPDLSLTYLPSGSLSKSVSLCSANGCLYKSSFKTNPRTFQRPLAVQASYSDGGRPSSGGTFITGFVLEGIIVGMLSAVYAPQRTRKILFEKIEQLNSAINDVSAQLRTEDSPNGVAVGADEIEAIM